MLILSRKLNERVMIGGGIVITVVDVDRNKVRLGIEAPPDVPVYREEIQRRIDAGQTKTDALRGES